MELFAQFNLAVLATTVCLLFAVQSPDAKSLRWWSLACLLGTVAPICSATSLWFGAFSQLLPFLALLSYCVQIACVGQALRTSNNSLSTNQDRLPLAAAALLTIGLVLVLSSTPGRKVEYLSALLTLGSPLACVSVVSAMWSRRTRRVALFLCVALQTVFTVGVLRTFLSLRWVLLPNSAWCEWQGWDVLATSAFSIAAVYFVLEQSGRDTQELKSGFDRVQLAVDTTGLGIVEIDSKGQIAFANRAGRELLRLPESAIATARIQDHLEVKDCSEKGMRESEFIIRPTTPVTLAHATISDCGESGPLLECSSSSAVLPSGEAGAIFTIRDITSRRADERFAQSCVHVLEMIARNKGAEEICTAIAKAVEERLPSFCCSLLICDGESFRVSANQTIPAEYRKCMCDLVPSRFSPRGESQWDYRLRSVASMHGFEGTWTEKMVSPAFELLGIVVLNATAAVTLTEVERRVLADATRLGALAIEHRRYFERLLHQGHHDALTGLPNRLLLADRLKQALARAERTRTQLALMCIDLDRFKFVNDTHGHDVGDLYLQQIGVRFSSRVRSSDTLARTGGDEFNIILADVHDARAAAKVAESILDTFREPFDVDGHVFYGGASIGIAMYPQDGQDAETLHRNADRAMYRAKAQGRNSFQYYSGDQSLEGTEDSDIETCLRRAVEQNTLVLHFQPQFTSDRELAGFEALVRLRQPGRGLIEPSRFIPLAEENGSILGIGEWVLNEACRQIAEWQSQGISPTRVAVNVSPLQFARVDFAETVAKALRSSGVKPELLELELTEGVLMRNLPASSKQMKAVADLGVRISVDDFGTGYSSLSYLHQLPIQVLKIDRSFIKSMLDPAGTRSIVEAIVSLAHRLGLKTVAEGVEDEEQLEQLKLMSCDFIQGYLFSRPLPASDAAALLWRANLAGTPRVSREVLISSRSESHELITSIPKKRVPRAVQ